MTYPRFSCCLLLGLLLPLCHSPLYAQQSDFHTQLQPTSVLPQKIEQLTLVDGNLCCLSSDLIYQILRIGPNLIGSTADTHFISLLNRANFAVRHPSGDLYLTAPDRKGNSILYRFYTTTNDKGKTKHHKERINLDNFSVQHPCFSQDGRLMVFSATSTKHSRGGADLWYSIFENGHWQSPINIGDRINTSADEINPFIYHDRLYFSSNGHPHDPLHFNLYATNLFPSKIVGDTIGMIQIGRSPIQPLPYPFNIPNADNLSITYDSNPHIGYLLTSSEGTPTIRSFDHLPQGVLLSGRITDAQGKALPQVIVTAKTSGNIVCRTYSDSQGYYSLFLRDSTHYLINYRLENHFINHHQLTAIATDPERPLTPLQHNVVLSGLALDQRLYYLDLFGPNADIELSPYGQSQLNDLIQFLNDNPFMQVQLALSCDLTDNADFNRMLTRSRLATLQHYLENQLPPSIILSYTNSCNGSEGCYTASGESRLTVLIHRISDPR